MSKLTKLCITAAAILALTAPADAKRKRRATAAPTTTLAVVVPDYCATHCQPAEFTLIEGTTCDYLKAVCLLDDGTGQPNCAWVVKSCD